MKAATSILLCLAASVDANNVSPIGKVVQLISDLQAKIVKEGTEAQKVYSQFAEFCEDRSKELQNDIKTGEAEKSELEATIAKEQANIETYTSKIEDVSGSIAQSEADLKAATKIRKEEAADFAKEEKELASVVDMLNRAIGVLEKEMAKGGASMMQLKDHVTSMAQAMNVLVQASAISLSDGAKLQAFIQAQTEDDQEPGAPAAAAYEGHSGDIISTLEGLLDKASVQLDEARKKETAAKHSFEMMQQSLEDDIKFARKEMAEAKKGLASSGEAKASAEGELKVTVQDLSEDTAALADLHKDCMTKAQDYEAATASRTEEITAITKAKAVIVESTANAEQAQYGFNQVSFFQLARSSLSSSEDLVRFEAVRHLRDLANQQKSAALSQLASRVAAVMRSGSGEDIFAKVKSLITDMVEKLEAEADEDATHKAYCDKEMAENKAKKTDKDSEIEKLTVKIEQMTSKSAMLKEEVKDLQKSLAEIAKAQAAMDKLRAEEKADYTQNKADLEQGLQGIKGGLKVLRDYYSNADGASHGASSGAGQSIIGLLEVVESDLTKSLTEVQATEESAVATYKAETNENEIETTSKKQDVKYKSKEAADLDKAVSETTADRASVQDELDAVIDTLKALDQQCVAKAETYGERKARREQEVAGLKEALSILDSQAAFIQQHSKRRLQIRHA